MSEYQIKLTFISGLRQVVEAELEQFPELCSDEAGEESIYLYPAEDLEAAKSLRSVSRLYLVRKDRRYHPGYISRHKSVLGDLVRQVISQDRNSFRTFRLSCAGSHTPEARSVAEYIAREFKLTESREADLKLHIAKLDDRWEAGAELTPRPLSLRGYKKEDIKGGMDPAAAFALNYFAGLEQASSYLNVFSGGGTLLIEAALAYPHLDRLEGFDNNKQHLSAAVRNIKSAGLIDRIKIREADILEQPEPDRFDVITSDLPFGMLVAREADLSELYRCFVEYSRRALNSSGRLAVYTTQTELLDEILSGSDFKEITRQQLKIATSSRAYLYPHILVYQKTQ